ncbi:MAG: FAD-binding oxidoreductase [Chloroflexota bacterium]|nr:FAD-binding oxidoreductase [Chloroflexota bacterium]
MSLVRTPRIPESLDVRVEALREQVTGDVFQPGDAGYDAARAAWNLSVNQYPAVVVVAHNADDIAAAVRFASAADLSIAMQATGHGVARKADGAVLIVTACMTDVEVDPWSQTAWVSAGVKWGKVLEAAQAVGLAPLLGSSPGVGAVGYTLGGGMGWLARKHGLSIDSVLRFEVVTAEGEMLTASADENSELFWAMRGGTGAFAIVTRMQIKLYPVTTIYGGALVYPAENARAVMQFFRDWSQYLPEEWTVSVALMNLPPLPELPPFLSGKSVVMVHGCYSGADLRLGQMMLQAWIDWQAPIANMFGEMPFNQVGMISNDPQDPMPGLSSGAWLADMSDETIDTLLKFTLPTGGPPALVKTEVRLAGGAMARVPADANAYSNRDAQWILQVVGVTPTPDIAQGVALHIRALKSALAGHLTGGVYLNFLEGEEKHGATQQAFAVDKQARLAAVKAQYDPNNRLSHALKV